jgi:peptidyl-prolyl cis-trans isomerase D
LNTVSKPIEGENGVFVINVTSVNTLPAPENLDQQKEAARNQLRSNASDRAYNALKKASNMEDNRDKVNVLGN